MITLGLSQPPRRPVEVRESFTDTVIARLVAASMGGSDGSALGAIETAARWWGFGLASATVKPSAIALDGVTPSTLDSIGRALCRSGESLHVIAVRAGRPTLTPCTHWTIQGDADPASWTYLCTLNGPSTSTTKKLPGAAVLHIRYAPHPSRPWAGRSPVELAMDTARAAGLLEKATSEELEFTQSQMLAPRRSSGDFGVTETLAPDTIQKIVSAFSEHMNTGAFVIPADVTATRLGPEPPDSFPLLRDRFEKSLLALHGLPPALLASSGTGTAMREAFRQVLHSLLKPLGAILAEEMREKLHPDAALDFSALRAADLMGSARAVGSLVKAGMSVADAREVAGL